MSDRPDPYAVLADHLRRLSIDPIVAAGIVADVAQADRMQRQYDDMERWRAGDTALKREE